MTESTPTHDGGCECGAVTFTVTGPPLLRALCHCDTCRAYNGTDVADVTAFRARDVAIGNEAGVEYRAWQRPALAQRGTCRSCGKPAVERASIPLLGKIVMLPSGNVRREGLLPAPSLHIFYDRRVRDASDDLPKRGGFVSSQTSFLLALARGARRGAPA